jgi:hypothetical protein
VQFGQFLERSLERKDLAQRLRAAILELKEKSGTANRT